MLAAIDRAVRDQSVFQLEHRILRLDGSVGWIFSRAIPVLDAGAIVERFGAASDIMERRLAAERLRFLDDLSAAT